MSLESIILEIRKDVKELKSQGRPKENWVPASWIMELTGWTCKKLEKARNAGQSVITWRQKKGKDPEYLLQSVPDEFKIKQTV